MTIRLTADERNKLQAVADANDERLSDTVRRAIRAFLATAAVVTVVLTLGACGSGDAPESAGQPTTMSIEQARQQVAAQHSAEMEAEATALAAGCTQTGPGSEFDERWNAQPLALEAAEPEGAAIADEFVVWLDALPVGCTDADVTLIAEVKKGAAAIAQLG